MQRHSKTLVVITGGTIESYYDPERGVPPTVPLTHAPADSVIPHAMEKLGLAPYCDFLPLCIKDSKETWLPGHMNALIHRIAEQQYDKVIVVQGTDSMPEMAQEFARRLSDWEGRDGTDATRVIFTGAMAPLRDAQKQWRGLSASGQPDLLDTACDGWMNLCRAFEDAQHGAPGVYIEMGQGAWPANEVVKHRTVDTSRPTPVVTHAEFVHSPGVRQDSYARGAIPF